LVVALHVVFNHAVMDLRVSLPTWVRTGVGLFPGVPILFFVSGFLISGSYEKDPRLWKYAQNRLLRIFPGLIVCTLLSILVVYFTGYFTSRHVSVFEIAGLALGQVSFLQFYNPEFMRGFGTGVLNGSLWTVTVVLQFYVLVPLLYAALGLQKGLKNGRLLAVILFFMAINLIVSALRPTHGEEIPFKLWLVSFSPWFYMFLVGVFFQRNCGFFYARLAGKFRPLFVVYLAVIYPLVLHFHWHTGNSIKPPLFLLLTILVFSLAYSHPGLGSRMLRGNDHSYGLYLYHVPVINLFVYYAWIGKVSFLAMVGAVTWGLAAASWVLIEGPFIRLKKRTFRYSVEPEGARRENLHVTQVLD
jgi:peptidoglycan/LPS O-acetylase OafA/YrhL